MVRAVGEKSGQVGVLEAEYRIFKQFKRINYIISKPAPSSEILLIYILENNSMEFSIG